MKRKKLLLIVLTFLGLVSAQWATAQNVTIGPNNGSLITGQDGGNVDDSGIQRGMASMWIHEQLQLVMTTSDIANLTSAGELQDPSCAIDKMTFNGEESLVIAKAHPHCPSVPTADIPLAYMAAAACLLLERAVPDQELPLDFHSAHRPCR